MYMDLLKICGNVKRNVEICEKVISIRKRELIFVWEHNLRKEAKRELQWWENRRFCVQEHLNILVDKIKNYNENI